MLSSDRKDYEDATQHCSALAEGADCIVHKRNRPFCVQKRIDALEQARPDKQYHLTFVTVNPLERNIHSDMVESAITAEELFK